MSKETYGADRCLLVLVQPQTQLFQLIVPLLRENLRDTIITKVLTYLDCHK